jgi:hypothetical protein
VIFESLYLPGGIGLGDRWEVFESNPSVDARKCYASVSFFLSGLDSLLGRFYDFAIPSASLWSVKILRIIG